jgi:hypothetical protein
MYNNFTVKGLIMSIKKNSFSNEFKKEMLEFYKMFKVEFPIACKDALNFYVGVFTFNKSKIKQFWDK